MIEFWRDKFPIMALVFAVTLVLGILIISPSTDLITEKKLTCIENTRVIPCENFTYDDHFCLDGLCVVDGICPGYYDILSNKTVEDCLIEAKEDALTANEERN